MKKINPQTETTVAMMAHFKTFCHGTYCVTTAALGACSSEISAPELRCFPCSPFALQAVRLSPP